MTEAVNVEAIIRRLREEIRRKGAAEATPGYAYRFEKAGGGGDESTSSAEKALAEPQPAILHSPHLRFLNEHWQVEPSFPITSHRPVVGWLLVGSKKLLRKMILGLFLPIFARMQDFFSNIVNYSNELARRVDQNADRSARNDRLILGDLEALGHKLFDLERETGKRFHETEKAIVERMDVLFQKLDRDVLSLERRIEDLEARTKQTPG